MNRWQKMLVFARLKVQAWVHAWEVYYNHDWVGPRGNVGEWDYPTFIKMVERLH